MKPLLLLSLLFLCCSEEKYDIPALDCTQPNLTANMSVATIYDKTTATPTQHKYDDVIEAYVVSTDEFGSFYKTLYLQTLATASPVIGFAIPLDLSDSYIEYRLGNKVYIKLKDIYTELYHDGMRIGNLNIDSSGKPYVGRISQNDYRSVVNSSCDYVDETKLVRSFSITELLNTSNINTLVEIKDVQFEATAVGKKYFEEENSVGGATSWVLEDGSGSQLFLRTSSFADFANNNVPAGRGTIRGILNKYYSDYQLVVRSEKDIAMDNDRKKPFYSEDFNTVTDGTNIDLAGWVNVAEAGKVLWKGEVYYSNGYADFTISGTKVDSNIAWLISPKIDLQNYKKPSLSFRASQKGLSVDSPLNTLEILISNNFNGVDYNTATWVKVPAIIPTQATPTYEFIGSGAIDLSAFKGKINVAFKYIGNGKDPLLDGSFRIDDVKINYE